MTNRRPDESDKAWLAWTMYRDLGPSRTLQDAWTLYAKDAGSSSKYASNGYKQWATKFDWDTRAQQWDAAQRSATAILAVEDAEGREPEVMSVAHLVATGQMDISASQSKILLRMMDHILGKPGTQPVAKPEEPEVDKLDKKSALKLLKSK